MSRLCASVLAAVGDRIAGELSRMVTVGFVARRMLDVGCWNGDATRRYATILNAEPHGIEVFEEPAARAEAAGVKVARVDLETGAFPWPDAHFDVVIANQVFEHLKNVWLPMGEVFRVLRNDGRFVISVPNLGSLHNRVLMGLGRQPTSIRTLGPHVRGYTHGEIRRFVGLDGGFSIERALGVGFYPFPAPLGAPFAALWPGASHTTLLVARKTRGGQSPWAAYLEREQALGLQTLY